MKKVIIFLLVLFVCILSCGNHEESTTLDLSSIKIAGNWELIHISGGFMGESWITDDYKYLYIKPDAEFGFFNDTALLAVGVITTETDSHNDLWYRFNVDSTKVVPTVPLPTNLPKMVTLLDAKNLVLSDPCCELCTYAYKKTKIKREFDW
ncbi:MAG: hypothetical protein IKO46_06590 [Salinivirgaceae bacterium]|nr:hypothetical protein [Salinivirgaceae bacterium]